MSPAVTTTTASRARATQSGTRFQVTQSIYQARLQTGSGVNSNDLLSNVYNPDTNTGQPTSLFCITYKVNALGQRIFYADPNGTQHQYTYDVLGRLTSDTVTNLGFAAAIPGVGS
jgi:YD repeat-containing protein